MSGREVLFDDFPCRVCIVCLNNHAGWASQCRDLLAAVDESDVALLTVVTAIVARVTAWEGPISFCVDIMLVGEAAEREIRSPSTLAADVPAADRRKPICVLHDR